MKILKLKAREIKDTRNNPTIEVQLKTDFGKFISSAPNGKSKGKYEKPIWKKSLNQDIKEINNFNIYYLDFKKFEDVGKIEKIFNKKIGGNSIIALEYVFLKALAKEQKKQVWELINPKAKKIPSLIGNVIGGGLHSNGKKPDFQEFHLIPLCNFKKAVQINKFAHKKIKKILFKIDNNFRKKLNDENAWSTSLNDIKIIFLLDKVRKTLEIKFKCKIILGIDFASSSFYKKNRYLYKNYVRKLNVSEQIEYIKKISDVVYYLEDPLQEKDFLGFSKLLKKTKNNLVVGDDLTVTNLKRIKKAHKNKSINAVIIKPNQIGSLIEVKKCVDYCKKNKIKIIFSHRSGETKENILSDLAFGFQSDFIKTGVLGKGRDEKLKRMIEIENKIK